MNLSVILATNMQFYLGQLFSDVWPGVLQLWPHVSNHRADLSTVPPWHLCCHHPSLPTCWVCNKGMGVMVAPPPCCHLLLVSLVLVSLFPGWYPFWHTVLRWLTPPHCQHMGRPVLLRSVCVGPKGSPALSTYGFVGSLGCCLCELQPQGLAEGLVQHSLTTHEDVERHLSFAYLINKCISWISVDEV